MYWDGTYILVIIAAIVSALAAANVKGTYKRYESTLNRRGLTAEQVATSILRSADITDVRIERISGSLSDHYSPNERVLRLSDSTYRHSSVAAIGVAAHECGHAIQHHNGYVPLALRSVSVPLANIGSRLSWPIILIGLILGREQLAQVGVILFAFVVAFQLITLPVEFNASRRAMRILRDQEILMEDELSGARKVLTAAALTYVAALFAAILQLLRLVLLTQSRSRHRGH